MIYYLVADGCERYNTFSPYYNFVKDKEVLEATGRCKVFSIPEDGYEKMRELVGDNKPLAIVCDPVSYAHFKGFPGIKLLVTNDTHRFTAADRDAFEEAIDWATLVLSSYCLSPTLIQEYYYPRNLEAKEVFFPHHVSCEPFNTQQSFDNRSDQMFVGGSLDERVYPMRSFAAKLRNAHRPELRLDRETFMTVMGQFKYAFTCGAWAHYTVAKYFEIMKVGAILIAETPAYDLERSLLGLSSGYNCHLIKYAVELLELPPLSPEIALHGNDLVMRRHTTLNRTRQVELLVEDLYHSRVVGDQTMSSYLKAQLEVQ